MDESAAAKRKAEAEQLAGKKSAAANAPSEEKSASPLKKPSIDVSDPDVLARLVEMSNKAAKKTSLGEEDLAKEDLTKMTSGKPAYNEVARLFNRFTNDENASLNLGKIKSDVKKLLKTTPVKSFISRRANPKTEPDADYTRALSDELHALSNMDTLHRQNITDNFLAKLPKEADRDMLARIYKAREADSAHVDMPYKQPGKTNIESMPAADKKVWDEHFKPWVDEIEEFHNLISQINPELAGPDVDHYVARIIRGNTKEYNALRHEDDPMEGTRYNGLSVNASMAKERQFAALEHVATGERHVIQNRPEGGFTLWKNHKATRVRDPNYEFEANQPYQVKNNKTGQTDDYVMRHATTDEIMASGARLDTGKANGKMKTTPVKYFQNAGLSVALAHARLGTMARNLVELARLSSTKEFQRLSTRKPTQEQLDAGWEKTIMPNFEGTYMDPQLREVMDDFARAGFKKSPQWLRNLNQAVTKLLFWMPTAHSANVGAHWFVGRGWDNLNVSRGMRTSMQAAKSVFNQDHIQREMMENGAGLIYPSVRTRKFIEQVANQVGEAMERDPQSGWREAAAHAGVPFKAVHDFVYNNSSKVMWAANDMFLTQRYLELKEKGYSPKEALAKAERDIPNYRVASRIGGGGSRSRFLSNLVQDPSIVAFGRYHAGMMNAYGDIGRNLAGSKASVGDRVEALGKLMALGALAMAYPVVDKIAKMVTGNEDATFNRRGPTAIPYHLGRSLQGKEDLMSAARSTMTLQPLVTTALETLYNKDFRGKNIFEPGDVAKAAKGDIGSGVAVVGQGLEHAARGLISPLNTLETTGKKQVNGQRLNPAQAIRDQALDIKNPSDAARRFERKSEINNFRDSRTRIKHGGSGLLEEGINKAFGR